MKNNLTKEQMINELKNVEIEKKEIKSELRNITAEIHNLENEFPFRLIEQFFKKADVIEKYFTAIKRQKTLEIHKQDCTNVINDLKGKLNEVDNRPEN